jgi:predicted outer membrane repeat protein
VQSLFHGGAILNSLGCLVIPRCDFTGNAAQYGGAIWNKGGIIALDDSEFRDNTASQGGAIVTAGGRVLLTQCGFVRNAAPVADQSPIPYGGALYSDGSADVTLVSCTFQGNTSWAGAGAIWVGSGTLTINACRFVSNRAEEAYGGVILIGGAASVSISGSAFIGNEARYGGGAISGGAELVCERCIFAGNRAKFGGAISFGGGTLNQCTTQGNRADHGSTLYASAGSAQVKNSILWDAKALDLWGSAELSVAYSDTYEPQPGQGNISVDPLFARAGYWDPNDTPADPNDDFWVEGDYHLKSEVGRWDPVSKTWVEDDVKSPCINAGDPKSGSSGNEPQPNGGRINMGAYGGTIEASKS